MAQIINFPNYFLQSDWEQCSINEKFWLHKKNLIENSNKTFYLKIINDSKVIIDDNNIDLNEFIVEDYCQQKCLAIRDVTSNVTHRFISPVRIFQSIHQKSIIGLDVAPTGIAVSSSTDGTMKIWDTCKNVQKFELKGHYFDVNCCRFFPSNEVIVSGASDMLIKIWSAIDGSCPVTLKGHTGSVTDIAIVDRGRNIISVGKDGKAKLWNCGKQICVENIFDTGPNNPINKCSLKSMVDSFDLGQREDPPNDDCVGTSDKMLLLATEAGIIYGVGVDAKKSLFKIECESAVNCVSFGDGNDFYAGTQNGCVYQYDLRYHEKPKTKWLLSTSPITAMKSISRPYNGIVCGRQDGSVNFYYENHNQIVHLVGSDCDQINQIVYDEKFIYTSCRDCKVRKYYINNAFE